MKIDLDSYEIKVGNSLFKIRIFVENGISHYHLSLLNISEITKKFLDKIKEDFILQSNFTAISTDEYTLEELKLKFSHEINKLIKKYFPNTDEKTRILLSDFVIRESLGLGDVEILLKDNLLEEITINNSKEYVWVYHRKYGWLKTNVIIDSEKKIRHFSTMIGREVGKDITLLNPLMDARLSTGDRVNATLFPITTKGNTITIRKFAVRPWTITDFLIANTINKEISAFLWTAIEYELNILITGGTGSGKTSMLNVLCSFIPNNQRIISIEDTRELSLPSNLHWVPMQTRLPNPSGKGEITMLDLIVNSLRMRPDRIIMGEVRRKREAEVMFEAMHTGHSVYATLHANNVDETINRLTNPPIELPKSILSSLSLILVQNRNRRTNRRRTFQIAEITPSGDYRMLYQYNSLKDTWNLINEPKYSIELISLYTGKTKKEIIEDINEKIQILKELEDNNIIDLEEVGKRIQEYYNKKYLENFEEELLK